MQSSKKLVKFGKVTLFIYGLIIEISELIAGWNTIFEV